MQQHRFPFSAQPVEQLVLLIETTATTRGLLQQTKGELKSLPRNTHWHYKRAKQKGTFEITLLHESREVMLSVHDNRSSAWTGEELQWWKEQFKTIS